MKRTEHMKSTLPTVLKEYSPEYEPKQPIVLPSSTPSSNRGGSVPRASQSDDSERISPLESSPRLSVRSRSKQARSSRSRSAISSDGLIDDDALDVKSRRHHHKADAERFEKLCEKWNEAKREVRLDQYECLKEKVQLQQELITRQDELARQKRVQQEQLQKQAREMEKTKKQARENALSQKCKESLEEDRKRERKSKNKENNVSSPERPSPAVPVTPQKAPANKIHKNVFQPSLPPLSRTPTGLETLEREKSWTPPSEEELQWHQAQLYKVLGKGADYFLHPKIEPPTKKPINNKMRKMGGSTQKLDNILEEFYFDPLGRVGSEKLLETLRNESKIRLLQADAHIPQELKDTYGAFVRESIGKERTPVRRFFCAKDDVPELNRLQDQSYVNHIKKVKHKTDLMYRASKNNEDRTKILFHNNAMPEVAMTAEDQEGVACYLPSWQDDMSDESELEYKKWLADDRDTYRDASEVIPEGEEEEVQEEEVKATKPNKYEGFDDELILLLTRKHHKQKKSNYTFMTERDTVFKGSFADKFKEEYGNKDIPKPFDGSKMPENKSKSVLGLTTDLTFTGTDPPSCKSAPIPEKHNRQYIEYVSSWEPLSMHALIEYKRKMDVEGDGEFQYGRPKMWSTDVKAAS